MVGIWQEVNRAMVFCRTLINRAPNKPIKPTLITLRSIRAAYGRRSYHAVLKFFVWTAVVSFSGIKKENIEQLSATRCFPEGRKNRFMNFHLLSAPA
jgi:hypothetical protein